MSLFEQLMKQAGMILDSQSGNNPAAAGPAAGPEQLMGGIAELLSQKGLGPLLQMLKEKGLGEVVASWVGTGANLPVTPEQLEHGLGHDVIEQLAARLGLPPGQASALLAQFLPLIVDRLTPNGTVEGSAAVPGGSSAAAPI